MKDLLKTLEQYKTDREVDEHNESYEFRFGYVKAINDAINLVKSKSGETVKGAKVCFCGKPYKYEYKFEELGKSIYRCETHKQTE